MHAIAAVVMAFTGIFTITPPLVADTLSELVKKS